MHQEPDKRNHTGHKRSNGGSYPACMLCTCYKTVPLHHVSFLKTGKVHHQGTLPADRHRSRDFEEQRIGQMVLRKLRGCVLLGVVDRYHRGGGVWIL